MRGADKGTLFLDRGPLYRFWHETRSRARNRVPLYPKWTSLTGLVFALDCLRELRELQER